MAHFVKAEDIGEEEEILLITGPCFMALPPPWFAAVKKRSAEQRDAGAENIVVGRQAKPLTTYPAQG